MIVEGLLRFASTKARTIAKNIKKVTYVGSFVSILGVYEIVTNVAFVVDDNLNGDDKVLFTRP